MGLYICECGFNQPDRDNPDYSQLEVDYYAWVHQKSGLPNHRLSLRKNLKTGNYEVYRQYTVQVTEPINVVDEYGVLIRNVAYGKQEVIASSQSLEVAIDRAERESIRAGHTRRGDRICAHKPPAWDRFFCDKAKVKVDSD